MDRHDYVKNLIEKRDEQERILEGKNSKLTRLKGQLDDIRSRSFDNLMGEYGQKDIKFEIKEDDTEIYSLDNNVYVESFELNSVDNNAYVESFELKLPENEQVSDEAILRITKEIFKIENKIEIVEEKIKKILSEIDTAKSEDFLTFLSDKLKTLNK